MELLHSLVYTGAEQSIELPPGTYLFKLWGGRGGGSRRSTATTDRYPGGKGGYAEGEIILLVPTTIKAYIGGGIAPNTFPTTGGWNGGGNAVSNYYFCGAGGGATDIRIGSGTLDERILVAGGGGGAGESDVAGLGGGLVGTNAIGGGTGGTQSAGGSVSGTLGIGGAGAGTSKGAGGGGLYGGGRSNTDYKGGGGGSSYIGGAITIGEINYPLIPISNGLTTPGVNALGHGWAEIWGSSSPIPTSKKRRFAQII